MRVHFICCIATLVVSHSVSAQICDQQWDPILSQAGRPFDLIFSSFSSWDPDGPGPRGESLCVNTERFNAIGEAAAGASGLMLWDGSTWSSPDTGGWTVVGAPTAYDFDGDGPMSAELVMTCGSGFVRMDERALFRWNGTDFVQMPRPDIMSPGETFGGAFSFDPDGRGPGAAWLCVYVGDIAPPYPSRIIAWNGQQWSELFTNEVSSIIPLWSFAAADLDGNGPQGDTLVFWTRPLQGSGANTLKAWRNGNFLSSPVPTSATLIFPTVWDRDNEGPLPPVIVVGVNPTTFSSTQLFVLSNDTATHLTLPFSVLISGIAQLDMDGPGPGTTSLVARFSQSLASTMDGINWTNINMPFAYVNDYLHAWKASPQSGGPDSLISYATSSGLFVSAPRILSNGAIQRLGELTGTDGVPGVIATADLDANASTPSQIIVGGDFGRLDGSIAEMCGATAPNSSNWMNFGIGRTTSAPPIGFAVSDIDGPGGAPPTLISNQVSGAMMRWSGITWVATPRPSQTGVFLESGRPFEVDPDGPGNEPMQIFAIWRDFAPTRTQLVRWTGTNWAPYGIDIPTGESGSVRALTWCPLGLAIAIYGSDGTGNSTRILVNQSNWTQVGPQLVGNFIFDMDSYDFDAIGPNPESLTIAVSNNSGALLPSGVASWDQSQQQWIDRNAGVITSANELLTGPSVSGGKRLIVKGNLRANGQFSSLGMWSSGTWLPVLPFANVSAIAWGNSTVSSTTEDYLLVSTSSALVGSTRVGGLARVRLTDHCCDSIDFNRDSAAPDPMDIEAFLSVYSEAPCAAFPRLCNDIDFNNDGALFDPCDINSFLLVYSEGPCVTCP